MVLAQPVLTAAAQLRPGSPLQPFLLGAVMHQSHTSQHGRLGFKAYLLVRHGYLQTRLETHASLQRIRLEALREPAIISKVAPRWTGRHWQVLWELLLNGQRWQALFSPRVLLT